MTSWDALHQKAASKDFDKLLQQVFGADSSQAEALREQILAGHQPAVAVVLLSASAMNGALGGYSATGTDGTPTIYLNQDLLAQGADQELLQRVTLEEIGHHLDHLINGSTDTQGDEGELFSDLVMGDQLTSAQLISIRNQNDAGFVTVNGQLVAVENAVSTTGITAINGTYSLTSGTLRFTVAIDSTLNHGADLLVAAYTSTGSLIGWQIVNRDLQSSLQGTTYVGNFNFADPALTRVDSTTISLRAWQGTAGTNYGTGNDAAPVITYGNASSLVAGAATGFAVNSNTAPANASGTVLASGAVAFTGTTITAGSQATSFANVMSG